MNGKPINLNAPDDFNINNINLILNPNRFLLDNTKYLLIVGKGKDDMLIIEDYGSIINPNKNENRKKYFIKRHQDGTYDSISIVLQSDTRNLGLYAYDAAIMNLEKLQNINRLLQLKDIDDAQTNSVLSHGPSVVSPVQDLANESKVGGARIKKPNYRKYSLKSKPKCDRKTMRLKIKTKLGK